MHRISPTFYTMLEHHCHLIFAVFPNFIFGFCAYCMYRSGPNLSRDSRTKVCAYVPNFIWIRLLCHVSGSKNRNLEQILTLGGAPVPNPLYRGWGTNLVRWSNRPSLWSVLMYQVLSRSVYCRSLAAKNTKLFLYAANRRHHKTPKLKNANHLGVFSAKKATE